MHTLQVRKYALVVLAVGWFGCSDETPGTTGGSAGTSGATSGTSATGSSSNASTGSAGPATSGTTDTSGSTSGAGGASSSVASTSVATGTGGAGGDTGATTTTGAGGAGGAPLPPDPASPLPFVVDSLFAASGYMGDGEITGAIAQDDNMTCATSRPVGAQGHCHKFTYTPVPTTDGGTGKGWAGVYWQYPANNWGTLPGKRIATGATKITFTAAGGTGGEVLNFFAGGINGTYTDAPKVSVLVTLTNTMAPYSIDLGGQTYDQVIGGFGWSAENPAGSTKPIVFTVDNIRWE